MIVQDVFAVTILVPVVRPSFMFSPAVSPCVLCVMSVIEDGLMISEYSVTLTASVALWPPYETVMVVEPAALAVTVPELALATVDELELYVAEEVTSVEEVMVPSSNVR